MAKGMFIVIEGIDGTGKATQAELLAKRLREKGFEVVLTDFPQYGKNAFADSVAAYLRNEFGPATEINPYLASFAYAGDRAKKSGEIKELINKGVVVVSNRYTSANMGHQGAKIKDKAERKKFLDWLKNLEYGKEGYGIPKPDITFLLYLNPEISQQLVDAKAARNYTNGQKRDGHESNLQHLKETAETFLDIASGEEGWHVINCESDQREIMPREEIHEKIWKIVSNNLNLETSRE